MIRPHLRCATGRKVTARLKTTHPVITIRQLRVGHYESEAIRGVIEVICLAFGSDLVGFLGVFYVSPLLCGGGMGVITYLTNQTQSGENEMAVTGQRGCESFTTLDGEMIEAVRDPETGAVLYKPHYEAIFNQHESCLDIVGFKRPVMIPVFPEYTPNGKKLAQLPSLEDIERRDIGSGYEPCMYGYYRKVSTSTPLADRQNKAADRAEFVVAPEPPDRSEGMYLSYISRTSTNAS